MASGLAACGQWGWIGSHGFVCTNSDGEGTACLPRVHSETPLERPEGGSWVLAALGPQQDLGHRGTQLVEPLELVSWAQDAVGGSEQRPRGETCCQDDGLQGLPDPLAETRHYPGPAQEN